MTVQSTNRVAGPYTGNSSTTVFPFAFTVFAQTDVVAVQTDLNSVESTLTLGANYTVALNADQSANPGGNVTLTTALPTGYLLTLTSQVALTQQTSIPNAGGFYPAVVEAALDKLTIAVQQVNEVANRAVVVPISSSTTPESLIAQLTADAANAATNAAAAASSASAASASQTAATASATSATASQASAASSASSASASASSVATALATFNGMWLGEHTSDPTVDGSGNPLQVGARYLNTSVTPATVRVYTASGWQDEDQVAEAASSSATLAATQAQSSATAAAGSATTAATSATNASTSATAAATSATAASTSATNAAASAAAAATFNPANFQGKRIGEIFDFAGPIANIPSGAIQLPTVATNLSRTVNAALFNILTIQVTGNTTNGNATISGVSKDMTASVVAGMPISGPGIPAGATVSSATSTTIVLSAAATATASGVAVVIAPWGVGDGSTTFGCPYAPVDYATVHNPENVGTQTVGQVIEHTHSGYVGVGVNGSVSTGGSGVIIGVQSDGVHEAIGMTGGAANLPAGVRVIKCIQVS